MMSVERLHQKGQEPGEIFIDAGIAGLFQNVLSKSAELSNRIRDRNVVDESNSDDDNLTYARKKYANRILATVFACRNIGDHFVLDNLIIGPVIHPSTGKKESTVSFEKYQELRQNQVKLRGKEGSDVSAEQAITKAVVCYDLLHTDLSKPVHLMGLASGYHEFERADPPFREAVKVLYNRSRIVNILKKFEEAVNNEVYPSLPELHQIDFTLLKRPEEKNLLEKYVAKFFPMLETFDITQVDKIPSKLWHFLLHLSQDYSVYYGRCRSLCDSENQSYFTMYARIWLLKIILELYSCGFTLLNIKPVEYV